MSDLDEWFDDLRGEVFRLADRYRDDRRAGEPELQRLEQEFSRFKIHLRTGSQATEARFRVPVSELETEFEFLQVWIRPSDVALKVEEVAKDLRQRYQTADDRRRVLREAFERLAELRPMLASAHSYEGYVEGWHEEILEWVQDARDEYRPPPFAKLSHIRNVTRSRRR